MNEADRRLFLKESVEASSGGRNTVLFDDQGNANYMYRLPMFTLDAIDPTWPNEPHPAFIVDGVYKSEILIGQYLASKDTDGNAVSQPNKYPWRSISLDDSLAACAAKGSGWHLMTNAEWAAIMMLAYKTDFRPNGNTNYGRDYTDQHETGIRGDTLQPGDTSGSPYTRTGSGPASWRHDGTMHGIADMNGNVYEHMSGLMLISGEIRIMPNNNAVNMAEDDDPTAANGWYAIEADGALTATLGQSDTTLKYDTPTTNSIELDTELDNQLTADDYAAVAFSSLGYNSARLTSGVPDICKYLALYPTSGDEGRIYIRNQYADSTARHGCPMDFKSAGGLSVITLSNHRYAAYSNQGFRPCYVG